MFALSYYNIIVLLYQYFTTLLFYFVMNEIVEPSICYLY